MTTANETTTVKSEPVAPQKARPKTSAKAQTKAKASPIEAPSGTNTEAAKPKAPAKAESKPAVAQKATPSAKPPKAAEPKPVASPTQATTLATPRRGGFPHSTKLVLMSDKNPHREGTNDFDKFNKLKKLEERTVGDALDAGLTHGYINYMVRRKLVEAHKG